MNVGKIKGLDGTLTPENAGQSSVNVDPANPDAFRTRMKALVANAGSIAAVAQKCGMPASTVKKWVDGISDPARERCIALARGMGVSLVWLVAGEGPMLASDAAAQEPSNAVRLDPETIKSALELLQWAFELQGARYDPAVDPDLLADTYAFLIEHGGSVTPNNLIDFSKKLAERRAREAERASREQGTGDAEPGFDDPRKGAW